MSLVLTRRSDRAERCPPRRIVSDLEMHTNRFVEPGPEALVFLGPKAGSLRRAGLRRRWWVPATEAAGFPGLKFHELRHTFVALWIAAGAGAKEISTRAGHSSVAFTLDRYGHLYDDAEDEIPERLDALLFQRLAPHTRPKR